MVKRKKKQLKEKEVFYKEVEKFIWRSDKDKDSKILESFTR